jgi:hypothetical protein
MFNEKKEEYSKKQNKNIEVWQSPKYIEARDKAIELIESKKFGLTEGDFWILMNETKTGKMGYSGLIISHNGCLKINDNMENKIKPSCFKVEQNGYNNSLFYTYCDEDVYEVGEVSKDNCTNAYPYAMAFKRCFDRAVLKKCKLAYAGVYSDSEAEEFTNKKDEEEIEMNKKIDAKKVDALYELIKNRAVEKDTVIATLKEKGYDKLADIKIKDYMEIVKTFENFVRR